MQKSTVFVVCSVYTMYGQMNPVFIFVTSTQHSLKFVLRVLPILVHPSLGKARSDGQPTRTPGTIFLDVVVSQVTVFCIFLGCYQWGRRKPPRFVLFINSYSVIISLHAVSGCVQGRDGFSDLGAQSKLCLAFTLSVSGNVSKNFL